MIASANTALTMQPHDRTLKEALMVLYVFQSRHCSFYRYEHDKKYALALKQGLEIRKPDILSLVAQHNLYAQLENMAVLVMEYDYELGEYSLEKLAEGPGLQLLIHNKGQIPVGSQSQKTTQKM